MERRDPRIARQTRTRAWSAHFVMSLVNCKQHRRVRGGEGGEGGGDSKIFIMSIDSILQGIIF